MKRRSREGVAPTRKSFRNSFSNNRGIGGHFNLFSSINLSETLNSTCHFTFLSGDPDEATREKAIAFIRSIMELAAQFGSPAIIGSMQGRAAIPLPGRRLRASGSEYGKSADLDCHSFAQ